MTKIVVAALVVVYLVGFCTAVFTAAETWGGDKSPPWYAYPILIAPAVIWPVVTTIHAVATTYQGTGKKKSSILESFKEPARS